MGSGVHLEGANLDSVTGAASIAGEWRFSTSTVEADPGSGRFRYDDAVYANVTEIFLSESSFSGGDFANILGLLSAGDRVYIQQQDDAARAALWDVTGPAVDNGTWVSLPVTLVIDGGGGVPANNASCAVVYLFGAGATSVVTLQGSYNNDPTPPQIIASSGNPVSFRAPADPDTIFQLQRNDAGQVLLVESLATGYEITLGPVGNRSWVLSEPATNSNPTTAQIIPDGRTKTVLATASNSFVILWESTFISNIPGGGGLGNESGFGAVGLVGVLEILEQGNLFSTSIVFNQATRLDVTAANSGPVYTMVNQPQLQNFGATNRTVSQSNAVRSQLRIQPNSSGDVTLTSHEIYFASIIMDSSVSTGDAFCGTVNYLACKAPTFLGVGGAITTLNYVDMPNVPAAGVTNIRGINSAMGSGTFINHTGAAISEFAGDIHINSGISLMMGSVGDNRVELRRPAPGQLRVGGIGGTNNESLNWDFDPPTADTISVTSPTGAGIKWDLNHISFGTTDTGGGVNWFVIFAAPNLRSPAIAGGYADVLWTAGGTIDINGLAMSDVSAFQINSISTILNGGSIADSSTLYLAGMASANATRVQCLRVLGRARIDGRMNHGSEQPGQLTANTNDWQLGANNNQRAMVILTTDGLGPYNVTGIDSSFGRAQIGEIVTIYNASADTITFTHLDVLSLAANRLDMVGAAGVAVGPRESIKFWYDDQGSATWFHIQEQ